MAVKIGEIAVSAVKKEPFAWQWLGWHYVRKVQKDFKGIVTGYIIVPPLNAEAGSELSIIVGAGDCLL